MTRGGGTQSNAQLLGSRPALVPLAASSEVLRLEHQVLYERLILEVSLVLGRAPLLTFARLHVLAIARHARDLDVVGHHHGAGAQPALLEDPLEIGEVGGLVMVDEDEVKRALPEAVPRLERGDRV